MQTNQIWDKNERIFFTKTAVIVAILGELDNMLDKICKDNEGKRNDEIKELWNEAHFDEPSTKIKQDVHCKEDQKQ